MIGVLASGSGTNLQALLDAGLPVVAVASNKADAPALDRARTARVAAAAFPLEDYADRRARDLALADWLAETGVRLVVLAGDTPETLHERIKRVEHRLLPEVVRDLCVR